MSPDHMVLEMIRANYGDIYVYEERQIVIYYDGDSKVVNVRIWEK